MGLLGRILRRAERSVEGGERWGVEGGARYRKLSRIRRRGFRRRHITIIVLGSGGERRQG